MGRKLHTFLRVVIPGGIILLEMLLLYVCVFRPVPGDTEAWTFLSANWGDWTGMACLALVCGWGYYNFEITYKVDGWTLRGMGRIRENIAERLLQPFRDDAELSAKLPRIEWRALRRIFFQFIDENPTMKASNEGAFLSGIAFYSFLDLATISSIALVLGLIALLWKRSNAQSSLWIYLTVLVVVIPISISAAHNAIRKHRETSNLQLDAILSEHLETLRERLIRCII